MKTWHERIAAAEVKNEYGEPSGFTSSDNEAAKSWVTCACGEQDRELIESSDHPWDSILYELGISFDSAVHYDEVERAKTILDSIQLRSRYLLHLLCGFRTQQEIEDDWDGEGWSEDVETMMREVLSKSKLDKLHD